MTETRHDEIFREIHAGLSRQGPGDLEATGKAFSSLTDLPAKPKILDVGCGPGLQTVELAKLSGGTVVALDINQSFLDELERRAAKAGLRKKIRYQRASMFEMPFEKDRFDVVWSEGAIFIIGFERGLREWRHLIKTGGYMVASHISWLKSKISIKPRTFWRTNYPAIATIGNNLRIADAAGYRNVGHFTLPEAGWWDDYYFPLEANLKKLRMKYRHNQEALAKISNAQEEIDLYRNYSASYGYVFYILKKKPD